METAAPPTRHPTPEGAVRERFDRLAGRESLSVHRAFEVVDLGLAVATIDAAAGATPSEAVLARTCAWAGAGTVAADPSIADALLGEVVATCGEARARVAHERYHLDPEDWFRSFVVAAVRRDRRVLGAVRSASEFVDAGRALPSRGGEGRAFFRSAGRALAGLGHASGEQTAALAEAALEIAAPLIERFAGDYRADRVVHLVLPLLEVVAAPPADVSRRLVDAVRAHERFYESAPGPGGAVCWGACAVAALAAARSASVELPSAASLPASVARLGAAAATRIEYAVPPLAARTMLEARARCLVTAPDGCAEIARRDRDGVLSIDLEARSGEVAYRFTFSVADPAAAPASFGAGTSAILDPAELLSFAASRLSAAEAAGDPDAARAAAAEGLAAVDQARAALAGTESELLRALMTSPLGRSLCDEAPDRLAPAALDDLSSKLAAVAS